MVVPSLWSVLTPIKLVEQPQAKSNPSRRPPAKPGLTTPSAAAASCSSMTSWPLDPGDRCLPNCHQYRPTSRPRRTNKRKPSVLLYLSPLAAIALVPPRLPNPPPPRRPSQLPKPGQAHRLRSLVEERSESRHQTPFSAWEWGGAGSGSVRAADTCGHFADTLRTPFRRLLGIAFGRRCGWPLPRNTSPESGNHLRPATISDKGIQDRHR